MDGRNGIKSFDGPANSAHLSSSTQTYMPLSHALGEPYHQRPPPSKEANAFEPRVFQRTSHEQHSQPLNDTSFKRPSPPPLDSSLPVKRKPGRPKGSKTVNRRRTDPHVDTHVPPSPDTGSGPSRPWPETPHTPTEETLTGFYAFQWKALNICAQFYQSATDLVSNTPPDVLAHSFEVNGSSCKADPLRLLKEAKEVCDMLIADPDSLRGELRPKSVDTTKSLPQTTTVASVKSSTPPPPPVPPPPQHEQSLPPVSHQPVRPSIGPTASPSLSRPLHPTIITPTSYDPGQWHNTREHPNPTKSPAVHGAWDDEETAKLQRLAEESKKRNGGDDIDWDWVADQFGDGRTRHQVLIKATTLGLKTTTTHASRSKRRRETIDTGQPPAPPPPPTPAPAAPSTSLPPPSRIPTSAPPSTSSPSLSLPTPSSSLSISRSENPSPSLSHMAGPDRYQGPSSHGQWSPLQQQGSQPMAHSPHTFQPQNAPIRPPQNQLHQHRGPSDATHYHHRSPSYSSEPHPPFAPPPPPPSQFPRNSQPTQPYAPPSQPHPYYPHQYGPPMVPHGRQVPPPPLMYSQPQQPSPHPPPSHPEVLSVRGKQREHLPFSSGEHGAFGRS